MGGNNQRITPLRSAAVLLIALSAVLLPWWCAAALCVIALFYFESFYEMIFAGLLMDSLYGTSLYATSASTALFLLSIYLKKRLKFQR